MTNRNPESLTEAETLMKQHRVSEAIELFEGHLRAQPDDTRALLKLGVCHLLNGSEEAFLTIYDRARRTLERLRDIPADLARLWDKYRSLMVRVTASALIVGGAATLPGCTKSGSEPSPQPGATQPGDTAGQTVPAPQIADAAPQPDDTHLSAKEIDAAPLPPDAAPKAKADAGTTKPASMHRYSGGVYMRPKPEPKPGSMHKYSGGVYKEPKAQGLEDLAGEIEEGQEKPAPRNRK
jgi:hypothetical protein